MIQASEKLYTDLGNWPAINMLVQNRIFPVVADEDVAYPFLIYKLQQVPLSSNSPRFNAQAFIYFNRNQYDDAAQAAEDLKEFVDNTANYYFEEINIDFVNENQSIVTIINFNFD
jgi:hypothetical protein